MIYYCKGGCVSDKMLFSFLKISSSAYEVGHPTTPHFIWTFTCISSFTCISLDCTPSKLGFISVRLIGNRSILSIFDCYDSLIFLSWELKRKRAILFHDDVFCGVLRQIFGWILDTFFGFCSTTLRGGTLAIALKKALIKCCHTYFG